MSNTTLSEIRHVNTKLLQVFVLVMEYRNLGAVAACTQRSVSTVSYSLDRLGEITGDPLFFKGNGILVPTPHAIHLEKIARQILAIWGDLVRRREEVTTKRQEGGRRVAIGFSASIGDPLITEILFALGEEFPQDTFVTRSVIADAVLASLLDAGELDCAFVVDSGHHPERVRQHNIVATQRRLVGATRRVNEDKSENAWILLQEDSEPSSPLRAFLSRQAGTPGYRETVVPSWHAQITLLHSAGGICSLLDYNVPLVTRERETQLLALPCSFPKWAALNFWGAERSCDQRVVSDVMEVGRAVLRDPLKAIGRSNNMAQQQLLSNILPEAGAVDTSTFG
ncbi:LysR family transcriptional regulator [Cupriavidus sp. amp6]|uniref:LysR family transcriptional regulator n=1 Tax=Cupriavidus sp. amp6 TaxID=388051 RepID=UPI0004903E07|nr:LysR family transcriptional regulator [Cupriavidus sp. amp6]